jgi:glycosyltransferase involved in cell wall biosynthesis
VADYIERCIRSIEAQNIPQEQFEIICVNDGSPDNVSEIVIKLQQEFKNIILINQENQGVSRARNNAIKIAHGELILPIDPDDYIVENSLLEILNIVDNNFADLYLLKVQKINELGQLVWETDYSGQNGLIHQSLQAHHESKGENISNADPDRSWAILYRNKLIQKHEIYYPNDVPFLEDAIFVAKFFALSQNYMLINNLFYMRTIRIGSATNSDFFLSKVANEGFVNGLDHIYGFLQKYSNQIQSLDRLQFLRQIYVHFCILPLIAAINSKNFKGLIHQINSVGERAAKIDVKNLRFPYNIYGWTFFKSPYLFVIAYSIITIIELLKRKIK